MRIGNTNINRISRSLLVLLAVFLTFSATGIAQEVKSDYEIQQDFKQEYKKISNNLEEAGSSAAVEKLIEEVKTLEETYASHEELLDKALYPDNFEEKMQQLKKRALATQKQLATIEKQDKKLRKLTQQLTSYDSRLESLNSRTDSLRNAMEKSIKSEKQLSGMVREYRESLEQRDDLILSFVDSVMITYRKLNAGSLQDLENAQKRARLNADGNALEMIRSIADENISLLNSEPKLTTEEYLRMSSVYHEFKNMWDKVGDKLVEIYAEGDKEEVKKNITEAVSTWNKKISSQTWASINKSFDEAGIQLPKFSDSETFYKTLNNYLSGSVKSSKEDGSREKLQNYRNFNSFWTSQVKADWTPYMIDANILSSKEMASIDQHVEEWAAHAEPESNLLVYLLGISVLAIVALGVMLAREKRGKA